MIGTLHTTLLDVSIYVFACEIGRTDNPPPVDFVNPDAL
jgi:hypothetical protein